MAFCKVAILLMVLPAIYGGIVHIPSVTLGPFGCADGVQALTRAYTDMQSGNCNYCDRYFHCRGNYEAKQIGGAACEGWADQLKDLYSNRQQSQDTQQDVEASLYGLAGGDCDLYLQPQYGCRWNPSIQSCRFQS